MFEWDPHKAFTNELKHGITFEEASTVFADTSSLTIYDELHSDTEERFIVLGR
ncbi:MAG: BrnT family toxin [Herpetosiphon sp.]|nr:BrnT family toxin [Herpetosiphon sp.]